MYYASPVAYASSPLTACLRRGLSTFVYGHTSLMTTLPTLPPWLPHVLLEVLREFIDEGRPEFDTKNGKPLGDGGFCAYCQELECDTDCLWERSKKLLAAVPG